MTQKDRERDDNGNKPELKVSLPEVKRLRASGPILILAMLFVVGAFLTWYFTWFGRTLSDADITSYLSDQRHPRRVQHALLQVQERIARGDAQCPPVVSPDPAARRRPRNRISFDRRLGNGLRQQGGRVSSVACWVTQRSRADSTPQCCTRVVALWRRQWTR